MIVELEASADNQRLSRCFQLYMVLLFRVKSGLEESDWDWKLARPESFIEKVVWDCH